MRIKPEPIHFFQLDQIEMMGAELWSPITEFMVPNVQPFYAVSTMGRVFSFRTNRILRPLYSKGYLAVSIWLKDNTCKNIKIHKLVMMAFNPNPLMNNGLEINHINGNKQDPKLVNLEWVTASENVIHAYETGLHGRGEDHYNAKYSESLVRLICECLQDGMTHYREIVDVCRSAGYDIEYNQLVCKFISRLKTREAWTHVSKDYNF